MNITIQIAEETLKDIERRLDGIKKPEAVVKTAVNNTAKKAQKLLASKASKVYAGEVAKRSAILSASTISKASNSHSVATIKFRSTVHEIKEFHVSSLTISKTTYRKNGKRGGRKIKGNVLRGSSKVLNNAFVVQFKNNNESEGHIAVVSRVPGERMKSNPKKEKLRKLLSPSYEIMIGGEKVYGAVADDIKETLNEEIVNVMNRVLGGKK